MVSQEQLESSEAREWVSAAVARNARCFVVFVP